MLPILEPSQQKHFRPRSIPVSFYIHLTSSHFSHRQSLRPCLSSPTYHPFQSVNIVELIVHPLPSLKGELISLPTPIPGPDETVLADNNSKGTRIDASVKAFFSSFLASH